MNNSEHNITITFSRGWLVTVAATGMGMVLGVLYAWSVIKSGIPASWGWSNADKALPYSVMCIVFSFTMVPAGLLQDRFGPRWIILIGGFLAGVGCIVAGMNGSSLTAYIVGLGIFTGAGVGFSYSAMTPAAIKWFPSQRTGLIAGIVVAGFGLAPVPLAPLTTRLLQFFASPNQMGVVEMGVSSTMITLGLLVWIVVGCLACFVCNPPTGFVAYRNQTSAPLPDGPEFTSRQMLATLQFWLHFFMYFSGAAAGLTFISIAQDLGKRALGEWAFIVVVVMALGNTLGRVLAGSASDKIGRQWTLFAEFICQSLVVAALFWLSKHGGGEWPVILLVMFLLGLNYGANLALFPAACKDYFGIRSFGLNYGCLFCAFGLAGLTMPWLNGLIKDLTGTSDMSHIVIICLMALSAVLALVSRRLGPPQLTSI